MLTTPPIQEKISLEAFLARSETKPASEYTNGKVIQKPMPQGEHSTLQFELAAAINRIGKPAKAAYAFPELRCTFAKRSIVPDLAVFRWARIPKTPKGRIANRVETYPDWTIEILSPGQSAALLMEKIVFCLRGGTSLGWLVFPEDEAVTIFQPDRLPAIQTDTDLLPALDCLPDWQLSAAEMFAWLDFEQT